MRLGSSLLGDVALVRYQYLEELLIPTVSLHLVIEDEAPRPALGLILSDDPLSYAQPLLAYAFEGLHKFGILTLSPPFRCHTRLPILF